MSDTTAISWCDATFNPWWGCTKVSPACDHCYAERDSKRFAPGKVLWGVGSGRRTFGDAHWQTPLKWAKTMPAKLGRRPRVFCASMGDWLDLDAPFDECVRLLDTIRLTPELDWLLLTKRIGNWRKRVDQAWFVANFPGLAPWLGAWLKGSPPPNVWLGSTVIDQAEVDRDVPKLLAVPARVRFLSIEPMLGDIRLGSWLQRAPSAAFAAGKVTEDMPAWTRIGSTALDWVIAGGESGPHARPAHPDWFRSLRDQCAAAGVPFHFKQWGEFMPPESATTPYRANDWRDVLDATGTTRRVAFVGDAVLESSRQVVRVGKKAAGRLLDGIEHNGFPA